MSFLSKGINKLSQIDIDVNKDWAGRLIKNLGAAVDSNDAVIKAQAILQSVMTSKGDIIYRGNNEAASLRGNYGVGYNFLHMKSGGQMEPEWLDIQDLIIYLTGALNRQVRPAWPEYPGAGVTNCQPWKTIPEVGLWIHPF